MKLYEILNEAIESPRNQIKQTLKDNKELLQKQKTRVGITRVLTRLFPGVNFKWFKNPSGLGAAYYNPKTRDITVGNEKLMTRPVVRGKWEWFVQNMTEFLTHESIHKEQSRRRDYVYKDIEPLKNLSRRIDLRIKHKKLLSRYEKATGEEKEETKQQLVKLIRKINAEGMSLPVFAAEYLSNKDEITAFAETIASDLVSAYEEAGYNKENAKLGALISLRTRDKSYSGWLSSYRDAFPVGDKTMKRVLKQTVRFIEQM